MLPLLFTINLVSTSIMVGVIWTIQVVHYPFFHRLDKQHFELHMDIHREKISYIVVPVMLAELASAIGLLLYNSQFQHEFIAGLILLFFIWISTAVVQVPSHSKLANGYNQTETEKLVRLNWIRTIMWSLRLAILLFIIGQLSISNL